LLIGMNTDVEIEIIKEEVALALPAGSLRTRKDVKSVALLLGLSSLEVSSFLQESVDGEGYTSFIVFKETRQGPKMEWVKVGKTDLNHVELISGLKRSDIVYVLPSEGLIKYQQRFSERLRSRFS